MDEEEFYRRRKELPPQQPVWTPFGISTVLVASNRRRARWIARIILLSIFGPAMLVVVLLLLNPEFYKSHNERGNSKYKTGDYKEALNDYKNAVELDPNDPVINYNLGNTLITIGAKNNDYNYSKLLQGCAYLKKSARLGVRDASEGIKDWCTNKDIALYYNERGLSRDDTNDTIGAIQDYTAALKHLPDDTTIRYNLAELQSRLKIPEGCATLNELKNTDQDAAKTFKENCI